MESALKEQLEQTVKSDKVVLFMKGTRMAPQCGFSAKVVSLLEEFISEYTTVNVLEDPSVRQGIKEYSSWPTVPQLYIDGEFVGGCDIITEMFANGDLEKKLGAEPVEIEPPKIELSDTAAGALEGALQGDSEFIRLEIDAQFNNDLSVGPSNPSDMRVESNGLTIVLSRTSARRANGVKIDFVKTPQGPAFKIDNPNEPPKVRQMMATELQEKLSAGKELELYDVRTPEEREKAKITGARHLDEAASTRIEGLDKETPLIFHCHHGGRSQAAAEHFLSVGFKNVYNLVGGIDAWSTEVDDTVPRY